MHNWNSQTLMHHIPPSRGRGRPLLLPDSCNVTLWRGGSSGRVPTSPLNPNTSLLAPMLCWTVSSSRGDFYKFFLICEYLPRLALTRYFSSAGCMWMGQVHWLPWIHSLYQGLVYLFSDTPVGYKLTRSLGRVLEVLLFTNGCLTTY